MLPRCLEVIKKSGDQALAIEVLKWALESEERHLDIDEHGLILDLHLALNQENEASNYILNLIKTEQVSLLIFIKKLKLKRKMGNMD